MQFGICLTSLFFTFVLELVAYRLGTSYLVKRGLATTDEHVPVGYNGIDSAHGQHSIATGNERGANGDSLDPRMQTEKALAETQGGSNESFDDVFTDASESKPAVAQILGVAMLEFGVVFHSVSQCRRRS